VLKFTAIDRRYGDNPKFKRFYRWLFDSLVSPAMHTHPFCDATFRDQLWQVPSSDKLAVSIRVPIGMRHDTLRSSSQRFKSLPTCSSKNGTSLKHPEAGFISRKGLFCQSRSTKMFSITRHWPSMLIRVSQGIRGSHTGAAKGSF
jgi:hypothetical protein